MTSFNKYEFIKYVENKYPSVFDNGFTKDWLNNMVDYAMGKYGHIKNRVSNFLNDILPELTYDEINKFDWQWKKEVLHELLNFIAGKTEVYPDIWELIDTLHYLEDSTKNARNKKDLKELIKWIVRGGVDNIPKSLNVVNLLNSIIEEFANE